MDALVERFKTLRMDERTAELQRLIGSVTQDEHALHARALLVTRLREEALWPGEKR